jgi:amidase
MGFEAENIDGTGDDSSATFRASKSISAYELWQLHLKRRELRQEYLEYRMSSKEWTGTGRPVDALITPMAPYPAPPHGENANAHYTMIFNCLDYTAITIPVTKVDPEGHVKKPREEFYGVEDKANYESCRSTFTWIVLLVFI